MTVETYKPLGDDGRLRLKLVDTPVGVRLDAVDREGHDLPGGSLLSIVPIGIVRHRIDGHVGLPLDDERRPVLIGENVLPSMTIELEAIVDRVRRVLEGKQGFSTLLSDGAEVVRISDIRAILDYLT